MRNEGISEKHFKIEDLDINSNSKYTGVTQLLGRKTLFLLSQRKYMKKSKLKICMSTTTVGIHKSCDHHEQNL